MKKSKVPRKLKKELCKVDCIEQTAAYVIPPVWRVKLKEGVALNKWTKRLINNIYREKRAYKQMSEAALERQMGWAQKGIYPIDSFEEKMRSKSPDEFRREYLNEPVLPRDLDSLRPSCVIIDDMGEQWQPANQKEVEEFLRRCNIWPHIQEPDGNGVAILKLPSLSKEKLEEFKAEWDKWARSAQPITAIDPQASIEFIPAKRPHRLHNHPRMEVELGVSSEEVIVDIEFVHLFQNAMAIRNDEAHFIVHKKEFLEILDSKGGGSDEADNLLRPSYERKRFEGRL